MALSPGDIKLVPKLKKIGMVYPVRTIMAARACGLSLPLGCSILMQETGGGVNEWGHDPTIFVGGYDQKHNVRYGALVTAASYKAYLVQRGAEGKGGMQGVGPCQLTYYTLQDAADKAGGCEKVLPNLKVGFASLAASIRRDGLRAAVVAYNGSGPAAEAYADTVLARAVTYAHTLGLPAPV